MDREALDREADAWSLAFGGAVLLAEVAIPVVAVLLWWL